MLKISTNTEEFPKWKPNYWNYRYIKEGIDRELAFKKFRNSCSAFISKPIVRKLVINKNGEKCTYCESPSNLQIDHIK